MSNGKRQSRQPEGVIWLGMETQRPTRELEEKAVRRRGKGIIQEISRMTQKKPSEPAVRAVQHEGMTIKPAARRALK